MIGVRSYASTERHPDRLSTFCAVAFAAAALLLFCYPPTAVHAVAPPSLPAEEVVEPGPRGIVLPDEKRIDATNAASLVFGASGTPRMGGLAALAAVYSGNKTNSWTLEGPLSARYTRVPLAASTLVLNGAASPFLVLGTLKQGVGLHCWEMIDTDRFRGIPDVWLYGITDNQPLLTGGDEARAYERFVIRSHYTSNKAFAEGARRDLTYAHLMEEADRYRGRAVRIEGRLLKVTRYDPTWEAGEAGVHDLYEAWIYNEQIGANPFCVLFTTWNSELPRDLLSGNKPEVPIRVSFDGYFFKKLRYRSNDPRGRYRETPLLIGNSLTVLSMGEMPRQNNAGMINALVWVFAVIFFGILVGVICLTYWYRRGDDLIRQRVLRQMPEFALPPPDEPPPPAVAYPPVAAPVAQTNGGYTRIPLAQRVTFPSEGGSGSKSADPGTANGTDGSSSGKQDKPPDEGAGA